MSPLKSAAVSMILQKMMSHQMTPRVSAGEKLLRGLAVAFLLTAIVLLMVAGYRWLGTRFDPIQTPALAAVVVLAAAGALWMIASSLVAPRNNPVLDVEQKVIQTAKDLFADVEGDLGAGIKDHPRAAASIAALVGFLLARRIL